MKVLFWRREIVCQQWVELVTDYLEGALPPRLERAIERHLADCPHCTEYLAQFQRTIALVGRLRDEAPPPPGEFIVALEAALAEHGGEAGDRRKGEDGEGGEGQLR